MYFILSHCFPVHAVLPHSFNYYRLKVSFYFLEWVSRKTPLFLSSFLLFSSSSSSSIPLFYPLFIPLFYALFLIILL